MLTNVIVPLSHIVFDEVGEMREALTADGQWQFHRSTWMSNRTYQGAWMVYHLPSCQDGSWPSPVTMYNHILGCQTAVLNGSALRDLEAHKAVNEEAS